MKEIVRSSDINFGISENTWVSLTRNAHFLGVTSLRNDWFRNFFKVPYEEKVLPSFNEKTWGQMVNTVRLYEVNEMVIKGGGEIPPKRVRAIDTFIELQKRRKRASEINQSWRRIFRTK